VSKHDTERVFKEMRSLSKSSRRLSSETGLRQVAIEQPNIKNYVQCLSFKPMIQLQEFRIAIWFRGSAREKVYGLDYLFFKDEPRFHLSGYINRQNSRIWNMNCTKIPCFRQRLVFGKGRNCGTIVL
jgi:hypothetical protein